MGLEDDGFYPKTLPRNLKLRLKSVFVLEGYIQLLYKQIKFYTYIEFYLLLLIKVWNICVFSNIIYNIK